MASCGTPATSVSMINPQANQPAGMADLEIISQQAEEDSQCLSPVQLVGFTYRDLPLAALDLSLAGSQLLSNLDEEDTREGSNWLKPCCGQRAALWQLFLFSAGFNCILVVCVVLVVLLLALELLIDTKLLQFTNAFQFASIVHWISLVILSVFFSETVFRIVILGIWDYIENKVEVFDGAVIVLSLAPMVASTVANGPSSPWDAISLIITFRIWRVKRIIDAYVLPVKVEMELEIQQYEKGKAVREEQLERLTQICQEQAFEIRQLRAHLAQQDLDLAAEREAAMQIHRVWDKQAGGFQVVDGLAPGESDDREPRPPPDSVVQDDMNNYISQYYSGPNSDVGVPEMGTRVITTAAIDVHLPNNPSCVPLTLLEPPPMSRAGMGSSASDTAVYGARPPRISSTHAQSASSHALSSAPDRSVAREAFSDYRPLVAPCVMVQELLSSLTGDSCLAPKGLDPVNLKLPSPAGSAETTPELERRVNVYNKKNQERLSVFQTKPQIHLQANEPVPGEKYRLLDPADVPVTCLPDT
ncbi:hypothetical protein AAFF_G00104960 [Aldrovandia affinis]|uniref:Transmembrane protein 266 n=1 Tax=Aldrovandia affinis TaxID=143900 RepID=A0AAD7T1X7_9TELE|nr:hypothetical protein AAFF_G00104960 [Aldrovandia affinis]